MTYFFCVDSKAFAPPLQYISKSITWWIYICKQYPFWMYSLTANVTKSVDSLGKYSSLIFTIISVPLSFGEIIYLCQENYQGPYKRAYLRCHDHRMKTPGLSQEQCALCHQKIKCQGKKVACYATKNAGLRAPENNRASSVHKWPLSTGAMCVWLAHTWLRPALHNHLCLSAGQPGVRHAD